MFRFTLRCVAGHSLRPFRILTLARFEPPGLDHNWSMHSAHLALKRVVRGRTGLGALAAVVAAACLALLAVSACSSGLRTAAVASAVDALPVADRSVSVTFGGAAGNVDSAAATAQQTLDALGVSEPRQVALAARPLWDGNHTTVQFAAVDSVTDAVRVASGRLPTRCVPGACEVIVIGDGSPRAESFGFIVVGSGTLQDGAALRQLLDPGATVLVAGNLDVVRALPEAVAIGTTTVWAGGLPIERVSRNPLGWLSQVQRLSGELAVTDGRTALHVPDAEIRQAAHQATLAAQRLTGLQAALALTAVAMGWLTVGRRRDEITAAERVAHQLGYTAGRGSGAWAVVLSIGMGVGLAVASYLLVAQVTSTPTVDTSGWSLVAGTTLATSAVALARLTPQRTVRGLMLVSATAGLVWLWRPTIPATAVPAGVVCAAALAFGTVPMVARGWRTRMARVVAANLLSALGATSVIAAVAVGTVAGAATQSAALLANARDHAVFASPLGVRLTARAVNPLAQSSVTEWAAASGGSAYPVLRLPATVRAGTLAASTIQVLGVPSQVWAEAPHIRHQTGVDNHTLEHLGRDGTSTALGISLMPGEPLVLDASGLDVHAEVLLWVYDGQGRAQSVTCVWTGSSRCAGEVPKGWSTFIGITIREEPAARARREHAAGEGAHDVTAPVGTLVVSRATSGTAPVDLGTTPLTIPYQLSAGPVYTPFVAAPTTVSAVTDRETATVLPVVLGLLPGVDITVQPEATALRLPTVTERFAAVDFDVLAATLAHVDPSLLSASEVWLSRPLPDDSPLLSGVTVVDQGAVLTALGVSPTRRWSDLATDAATLAMLAISLLAGVALARHMAQTLPFGPWRLLHTSRTDYLRAAAAVVTRQLTVAVVAGVAVSGTVANVLVRFAGLDVAGRVAAPPVAPVWTLLPLGSAAVLVLGTTTGAFILTASRLTPRSEL